MALVNLNKISYNENNNIPFNFHRHSAYHFDATKFGIYLRDHYCKPKGVNHIQEDVIKIPTDENEALKIPDIFNPRYSYGGGKLVSELICSNYYKEFFEKMIIFRPHNVYGPKMGWEHVIPQIIVKIKELSKISIKASNERISNDLNKKIKIF